MYCSSQRPTQWIKVILGGSNGNNIITIAIILILIDYCVYMCGNASIVTIHEFLHYNFVSEYCIVM